VQKESKNKNEKEARDGKMAVAVTSLLPLCLFVVLLPLPLFHPVCE
jgi:hypothetical protein